MLEEVEALDVGEVDLGGELAHVVRGRGRAVAPQLRRQVLASGARSELAGG